jgi:hypothetical protein
MATEGLEPFFTKILRQKTSKENTLDIAEYINILKREINISLGYKRINIQTLVDLSKGNDKRRYTSIFRQFPQTGSFRSSA